jgi:hypothetical protein
MAPQRWLFSIRDSKGKCVAALPPDGQDDVQQKFVWFHFINLNPNIKCKITFMQGRAILPLSLLLQETLHETVHSIGRWKIRHHYLVGWLRRSDELVG